MKKQRITIPKQRPRNPYVTPARSRKAGAHDRKGANKTGDWRKEWDEELAEAKQQPHRGVAR